MKTIILSLFALIIFINFAYRAIHLVRVVSRQSYAEDMIHHFQCSRCNETHTLSGPEAKKIRWAPRIDKQTPRSQSTSYIFPCPHCNKRAAQVQVFDTNITKGLGAIRIQMNDEQKPVLIDFLIKGMLPCILYSMLFSLIS